MATIDLVAGLTIARALKVHNRKAWHLFKTTATKCEGHVSMKHSGTEIYELNNHPLFWDENNSKYITIPTSARDLRFIRICDEGKGEIFVRGKDKNGKWSGTRIKPSTWDIQFEIACAENCTVFRELKNVKIPDKINKKDLPKFIDDC